MPGDYKAVLSYTTGVYYMFSIGDMGLACTAIRVEPGIGSSWIEGEGSPKGNDRPP